LRSHSKVDCLVSRQVSFSCGTNLAVRAWLKHVNGGVSGFLGRKNTEALGAVESCKSHTHHQMRESGGPRVGVKQVYIVVKGCVYRCGNTNLSKELLKGPNHIW